MFKSFCGQTGLNFFFDSESLPIDFFRALVSDDIMDIFVRDTNCCGQLKKGSPWTQTNKEEFSSFFGLLLSMGFIRLPTIREYWKKDSSFKIPGHDKLYKVRLLIESLNTAFRDIYYPTCELSVDERMVGFKGRLGFKQYLPLKPTKMGDQAMGIT